MECEASVKDVVDKITLRISMSESPPQTLNTTPKSSLKDNCSYRNTFTKTLKSQIDKSELVDNDHIVLSEELLDGLDCNTSRKDNFLDEPNLRCEVPSNLTESSQSLVPRVLDSYAKSTKHVKHHSLDRNHERRKKYKHYKRYNSLGNCIIDNARLARASNDCERANGVKKVCKLFPSISTLYGTWPVDRSSCDHEATSISSIMSFYSAAHSNHSFFTPNHNMTSSQQLGSKVECVYSLLSMLGSNNSVEMSNKFLNMTKNVDSCIAMRQSGCIPLLVQLVHTDPDYDTRKKAAMALQNVVQSNPNDKARKREAKVWRLLIQVREHSDKLLAGQEYENTTNFAQTEQEHPEYKDNDRHPTAVMATLMKISFDEEHRRAMCDLGAIYSLAHLIYVDHLVHGSITEDDFCITLRRYAGMALTNLTFGDSNNKALLCSFKHFMKALVAQLQSSNDDLMQVSASVIRNMSWQADATCKQILREVGAVAGLTQAAINGKKESTLKAILSALWNLSAHCTLNKVDICSVDGALGFLVQMSNYKAPSKTLAIIENAGGILRNISSHVAVREDYRQILRDHNFLMILLQQLKSPSLTIVSNACGTLWNLSSRCRHDQQFLWDNGAVPMLSSLIHSKHRMISMGSSAALKNLLNKLGDNKNIMSIDSGRKGLRLPCLPMLGVRKHKAQQQHQHTNITDTYENIEPFIPLSTEEEKNAAVFLQHSFHRSNIMQSLDHKVPSKFDEFQTQCAELLNRQCEPEVCSRSHEYIANTYSNYEHKPFSRFNRTLETVYCNSNEAFTTHDTPESDSYTVGSNTNRIGISDCELSKSTTNPQFMKNFSKIPKVGFKIEPESDNMSSSTFRVGKVFDFSLKFGAGSKEQQTDLKKTNSDSKTHLTSVNAELTLCNSHTSVVDRVDSLSSPSLIPFGDYQETDLDQPTNYSLRYAENDIESTSDSDEQNQNKEDPFTHDSVKCYYTEGTPYHTPHMFSTATSLSDLRVISCHTHDDAKSCPKVKLSVKKFIKESSNKKRSDQMCSSDEKDNCSDDNDLTVETPKRSQDFDFKFSSGLASPEKPINYCDEGTPGYFSRVSSLSSFGDVIEDKNTINANVSKSPKEETVKSYTEKETVQDMAQSEAIHKDVSGKCIEVVRVLDYAEETPLMFSRCSSLSSLSSIDQPDGPYDHSSVISDFSRLTSGVVSPSELPDSPTQAVPTSSGCIGSSDQQMYTPVRLVQVNVPLRSVFEDQLSSFLEESTPVHLSSVSSLSDLILECENKDENNFLDGKVKPHDEKQIEVAKVESRFDSECEEEDDDILAVCINIGMQNRKKVNGVSTVIDYSNPKRGSTGSTNLHCTEDTPIASKHNSDVSVLSIRNSISYDIKHTSVDNSKNVCDGNEELSDSSDSSSDTENVLAECIKSGLPKGLSLHPEHSIPNVNKDKHDLTKYLENEITGRSIAALELTQPIPNLPLFSLGRDEVSKFDMEGSPCNFSVISGLSDLTINSADYTSQANLKKPSWPVKSSKGSESTTRDFGIMARFQHSNSSPEEETDLANAGSSSSVSVKSNADDSTVLSLAISAGFPKNIFQEERILNTGKIYKSTEYDREQKHDMVSYREESALNKLSSTSSSSLDSVEACDGEQLLLKQCIESGMPKQKLMDVVSSKNEITHKDKRLFKAMIEHMTPELYYRSRNEQRVSDHNLDQSIRETRSTRRISEQPNKRTPNIDIDKKQGGKQKSSHISRLSINNDTNSNFCSSEHESVLKDKALLAECIYSGMPKRKSNQESQNKKPCKINSVKKLTHLNKNHHDSSSQTYDYNKYLQNQNQSQNIIQTVNPKNVLDTSAVVPGLLLACDAHFTDPAVGVETMIQFKSNGENIEDMQSTFRTCSQHSSENDSIHEANRFIVTANVVQRTLGTCSLMMKNGSEINVEHKYKPVVEVNNDHGDSTKSSRIIDDVPKFGNVQDNDRTVLSVTNNTSEPISYTGDTEISVVNYVNSKDPDSVSPNVDEDAEFGYPAKYSMDKELQSSDSNASESIRSFNANSSKSFLCNAWNEDSNSCDLSLPSISGSVPKLVFKANPSGHIEINESMVFKEKKLDFEMTVETSNNDLNNIFCENVEFNENPSLVTRLCEISNSVSSCVKVSYMKKKNQNDMIDGVNSINLDIETSPHIGNNATSLTNNATGESNIRMEKVIFQNFNRIDIKSLSSGLMVHKAMGNFMRSESIENAGNSCSNSSSCIQHYIKPPSAMEYILDMENSMTSVSSITSEIADCIQSESCQHPTLELCQSMIDSYENGNKSIEKIDPPSFIDFQLDKTVSTQEKYKFDCGKISTQKRNRQLCKDRYKTYVIGSELSKATEPVTQNNSVAQTDLHSVGQSNKILSSHRENDTEPFLTHSFGQPDYVSSFHLDTKSDKRKTVKQRRLEDRDRFRTRIIGSDIQEERHNTILTPNHTEFFKMQEDLQDIIIQDANLVLEVLNENDIKDDFIDLDCETLSLVSNDDELECSSLHLIVKKINCEKSTRDSSLNGSSTKINDAKSPYFYTSKSIVQPPIESDVNNKVIVDFTSLEYDQYSDTESCHQNISDNEEHSLKSPDHTKHEVFEKSAEEKLVKKPVKSVRGQCITAYVSPYRRGNSELHSKHNIVKPAINDTQKPVVKSSKSSVITKTSSNITFLKPVLQKTNITTETNRLNCKTSAKAVGNKCLEVQQKVIERQGTFVKENTSPSLLRITRIPMIGERKKFNNVSGSTTPSTQVKSVTQLSMLKKPSTHWRTKLVIKRPTGAEESTPSYSCQRKTQQLLRTKQLASRSANFSSTIPIINSYTDKLKTVKKTSPAHDVSSKIASLWRKVEKNEKHIAFNTNNETRSKKSACLASQATLSK